MPPSRAPRAPSGLVGARRASSASRGKPGVLAKPERFNPPSHGSRLKRGGVPKHYAPPLTRAEAEAQKLRHYPGLMPPEGTFAHRVWTSRLLHVFITMVSSSPPSPALRDLTCCPLARAAGSCR